MSKNIAIVGAGISGMSCAWLLKESGHSITIFAKAFSPNITSNKAAAFWFPYHIRNDHRGIGWCRDSYDFYVQMSAIAETGISMQRLIKVVREGVEETELGWINFMPEGALHSMAADNLAEGIALAYYIDVPLIETQIFLPYLQQQLKHAGVVFVQRAVNSLNEIPGEYDVVINCSGLGAKVLCKDDAVVPVRGQVALLAPKQGLSIYLDNERPLYIVPRKDAIIVGGTYEEGITDETTEPAAIQSILENAFATFPYLREQQVTGSWAGIRPYRPAVRVEHEAGTNIIHNYGHGGSGFTLAFGCAGEVKKMIATIN